MLRALCLASCLSGLPALSQEVLPAANAASLPGPYLVEGRYPDGTAYSGTAEISREDGRFVVVWSISGETSRGAGSLEGPVLYLDWDDGDDPVVYVVMPDGELHGTWADGRGLERLEPRR